MFECDKILYYELANGKEEGKKEKEKDERWGGRTRVLNVHREGVPRSQASTLANHCGGERGLGNQLGNFRNKSRGNVLRGRVGWTHCQDLHYLSH